MQLTCARCGSTDLGFGKTFIGDGEPGWKCMSCGYHMAPRSARWRYGLLLAVIGPLGIGVAIPLVLTLIEAMFPGSFHDFRVHHADELMGVLVCVGLAVVFLAGVVWAIVMLCRPVPIRTNHPGGGSGQPL